LTFLRLCAVKYSLKIYTNVKNANEMKISTKNGNKKGKIKQ